MVKRLCLGLTLLIALPAGRADGQASPTVQDNPLASYFVQPFGQRDGIPSNYVPAILQDGLGFLWLGTPEGLTRSNGDTFTTFDRRNTPAFRSHNVSAIAEDVDGSLWIGTGGGGIQRFVRGQIESVTGIELSHTEVSSLHLAPSGALWVGFRGALCRVYASRAQCFDEDDGLQNEWIGGTLSAPGVQAVAIEPDGQVWVATPDGAFVTSDSDPNITFTAVALDNGRPVALLVDSDGTLWSGTNKGQVGRLSEQGFEPVLELGESVVVGTLAVQDDGVLWAGTGNRGLARWDGARVGWITEAEGLPSDSVLSLQLDDEANLWVGTRSGLARVAHGLISQRGEMVGLTGHTVVGLSPGHEGTWVITAEGGLNRFRNGRYEPVPFSPQLPDASLRRVFEDRAGVLWLGTRHGLYRLSDGRLVPESHSLKGRTISAIFQDRDDRLWVGTANGGLFASNTQGKTWHHWTTATGLPGPGIYTIAQDVAGDLWVGTRNGLVRLQQTEQFEQASLTTYGPADGLDEALIVALHASADGSLYIGTVSYGLVRYRDGVFQAVSEQHGLSDATVWAILEDQLGSFWLSSNRGIARIAKEELEHFYAGRSSSIHSVRYGPSEGLLNPDCVGGFLSAGVVTAENQLAFATVAGVAFIDEPALVTDSAPPAAHVLSVTIDGQNQKLGEQIRVPAGSRRIDLQFGIPTQVSPRQVQMRARLLGFSDQWETVGELRQLTYTNIPPCKCQLELSTSRDGMRWLDAGQHRMLIEPHWYERLSVRILGFILLLIVVPAVLRLRLWQAADRERRLRTEVAERTDRLNLANLELEGANKQLLELSLSDPLTGLANRRRFSAALDGEWRRGNRRGSSLALVLIDIDRFKELNDSLGHGAGDEALRAVAATISTFARRVDDLAARIGGDELCLLLPSIERSAALRIAQLLRLTISDLKIPSGGDDEGFLTASLGVAVAVPTADMSAKEFLELADRSLYQAKSEGRNRVIMAEDPSAEPPRVAPGQAP